MQNRAFATNGSILIILLLGLVLALLSTAHAGDRSARTGSEADRQFFTHALQSGLAEVEMGRLAAKRAVSPAVREFAREMVRSHRRTNSELKALARRMDISMPTQPRAEQQQAITELRTLNGIRFDQKFMELQVRAHEDAIEVYARQQRLGGSATLRHFASTMLGLMHHHLNLAQDTAAQTGTTSSL